MRTLTIAFILVVAAAGLSATQFSYTDAGGTVSQTTVLTITGAALSNPAGTFSMSCPLTEISPVYPSYSEWSCIGGSLSAQATDGSITVSGTFTSGVFTLYRTSTHGGSFDYAVSANFSGSQVINGKSTAVIGSVNQTLAPLSSYLGTGTIQGGVIDISQQYEPIYIADTGNNRVVEVADALGSNWTSFGKAGSGTDQFSQPWGIALDSSGKIYVSDSGNCRIVRMDNMSGANWTSFGACGSSLGQFSNPQGLSVDASGKIYVADTGNNRIVRVDNISGTNFTALGSLGSGINRFNAPAAVTTDSAGNIYVADNANARVVEFADMTGRNWTVLQFPLGYLTPDGIAVDMLNRIYVTDSLQSQVIRADSISGVNQISLSANGAGYNGTIRNPSGVYVDPDGAVYLGDSGNNRFVRFFDMTYNDESPFGTLGTGVDTFSQPHGIVASPKSKAAAIASITPPSLTFPTEVEGVASPAQSTVLTNIGNQPFNITSVTSSNADFSPSNTCPFTLAGGQSCPVSVVFQPSAGGKRQSSLSFTLSGAKVQPVALRGNGALVTVSPSLLILFEGQSGTVTVTNPLSTSTTLKSIQIAGSTFSQTNNCGTLAPGASCHITVNYFYNGLPVLGTLTVTDSSGTSQYVSITGE